MKTKNVFASTTLSNRPLHSLAHGLHPYKHMYMLHIKSIHIRINICARTLWSTKFITLLEKGSSGGCMHETGDYLLTLDLLLFCFVVIGNFEIVW